MLGGIQIGINYSGEKDALRGCVNDALNARDFLIGASPFFLVHLRSYLYRAGQNIVILDQKISCF